MAALRGECSMAYILTVQSKKVRQTPSKWYVCSVG
jgi:hypothetical protein